MQHDAGGEDEGGVVAGDDERDEGVEADGGADVYECEKEVEEDGYADGIQGEGSTVINLKVEMRS